MNTDPKIAIITLTQEAKELGKKLQMKLQTGDVYTTAKLYEEGVLLLNPSLKSMMAQLFSKYNTLIFIMATGITVRMIAPYVQDKLKDPAVLVIDEKARHVISLLSGHMGGANQMTHIVSQHLGANPVITTATDVHGQASLDMIAKSLNAYIEDFKETVKTFNYDLIHGEKIGLYQQGDYNLDTRGFILIENLSQIQELKKLICITHQQDLEIASDKIIKVVPRDLVIGVGCKRATSPEKMLQSFYDFLKTHNIDRHAIKCVASVDIKKDEEAIIHLAQHLGVPFEIIERVEIKKVEAFFEKSDFVQKSIGVCSVAEPSAYLVSGGDLWIKKHKYEGITFAIGRFKR